MSDRELYYPLPASTVRALGDKMKDKRKTAATEIEKLVKELAAKNQMEMIRAVIRRLEELTLSQNLNMKKGGILGLAAVAIGLGPKSIGPFIDGLVRPVIVGFYESNSTVRFYAMESLHNIMKIARGGILVHFHDVFLVIIEVCMETDLQVRSGAEMLDHLLKDIVCETPIDLKSFIPILREKLYVIHMSPSAQMMVVSWICLLQTLPDVDLIPFISDILDGLFFILESPKSEVKQMCECCLGELLATVKKNQDKVQYVNIINILITHAQSEDSLVKKTALMWIRDIVKISRRQMLPSIAGILRAAIPCLSLDEPDMLKIRNLAEEVNTSLMELVTSSDDDIEVNGPCSVLGTLEAEDEILAQTVVNELDLLNLETVLIEEIRSGPVPCKTAALRWLYHLLDKVPNKMRSHVEELFSVLLKILSDESDEVVLLVLQVLAQIASSSFPSKGSIECSGKSGEKTAERKDDLDEFERLFLGHQERGGQYFTRFLYGLLQLFSSERSLLESRGYFIIRQLCVMLRAEDIYCTMADLLLQEENLPFACTMVQTLSMILLTSKELFHLRVKLRKLDNKESRDLFVKLYRCWSYCPVSTLTLCLLTQSYAHSAELIRVFGNLDVTTDFLVELDKLIQLIESPIFTFLRLRLLRPLENQELVETLYGILMLLPQTDAFQLLRCRLKCIPSPNLFGNQTAPKKDPSRYIHENLDYSELLSHFMEMQEKYQSFKKREIKQRLQSTLFSTS